MQGKWNGKEMGKGGTGKGREVKVRVNGGMAGMTKHRRWSKGCNLEFGFPGVMDAWKVGAVAAEALDNSPLPCP